MGGVHTALVIDDRGEARTLVADELRRVGFRILEAGDGEEGWASFRRDGPDLVVSDLRMPRADGLALLRRIRSVSAAPVILVSAHRDVRAAVRAMKEGAQEFLQFPHDMDQLAERARSLVEKVSRDDEPPSLERLVVGRSPHIRRLRERIAGLASVRVPVLVCGEPGTGRDCVVQAFHRLRERADATLVRVACRGPQAAQIPRDAGAIYLDEVGRLSARAQELWFEYLCGVEAEAGDPRPRVYASTSEYLPARAHDGTFHPALAARLHRFTVSLPPLRDRMVDLPALVAALLPRIGTRLGRADARVLPSGLDRLKRYPWPGNVRELEDTLERLIAFTPTGEINRAHVEQALAEAPETVASLRRKREQQQREELIALLRAHGGNLNAVGNQLSLSRSAVIHRARKWGLMPRTPSK